MRRLALIILIPAALFAGCGHVVQTRCATHGGVALVSVRTEDHGAETLVVCRDGLLEHFSH